MLNVHLQGAGMRVHSVPSLVAAAVMLLASSIPVRAQDSLQRRGWLALGLGTGIADIACQGDGCTSGWKLHGPTLLATVGLMLTPHVGVGLGLDQWWRSPSDSEATNTGTVILHYYPSVRAGAFVEVGAGLSRAEVRLDGGKTAEGRRWALMVGVGYEARVLRFERTDGIYDVTLTPRVSYVYSAIGDLTYAAGRPPFASGWRHQVLSAGLGVGLTFRHDCLFRATC